jgi:hypothetical protein
MKHRKPYNDDEPPTKSHFCDVLGGRVYAPKERCPWTDHLDGDVEQDGGDK